MASSAAAAVFFRCMAFPSALKVRAGSVRWDVVEVFRLEMSHCKQNSSNMVAWLTFSATKKKDQYPYYEYDYELVQEKENASNLNNLQ